MRTKLVDKLISTEYRISRVKSFCTWLEEKENLYTFLNPVSYLDALNHKNLFTQFDGIFADGILLVRAIEMLYLRTVSRRSFDMTSLAPQLFRYAQKNSKTIYIVASKQEQVEKGVEILQQRYHGLKIIGYRSGYFADEAEKNNEALHIVEMNPDFLIVGMGIVKQEEFLLKVKNVGFKGIGFTCGGFIHQLAMNKIDYYPKWIDRFNLRFLYRMWKEPHTRKRYLKAAVVFPLRFCRERLTGY